MLQGAIFFYLRQNKLQELDHIQNVKKATQENYLVLDTFTARNLEIYQSNFSDGTSLFEVLDKTNTPMGARLLKRWFLFPLIEKKKIEQRLEHVTFFTKQKKYGEKLEDLFSEIPDIERITGKISSQKINPKEILALRNACLLIEDTKKVVLEMQENGFPKISSSFQSVDDIVSFITSNIKEDCSALISKGNVIAENVDKELDEYREIQHGSKQYLEKYRVSEMGKSGISSLKIGFNNVFGYYLEVTNVHKDKVPTTWTRKQTLTSAERYITPELKEFEDKILFSEGRILEIEKKNYSRVLQTLAKSISMLQKNATIIAYLDCILSFSKGAIEYKYVCPSFSEDETLDISKSRHPVIERTLPPGEKYIPNNLLLDETKQISLITGPNMSGKSSFLRQVALISYMAQLGSFVPASSASLPIMDRIFTRVGASDNLSGGESTFMVEMNESAKILNNLTKNSLIVLDEIGRGTSTYDGISIAWSIIEFLHEHPLYKPKTLFATHYHELIEMEKHFRRIVNFHVSITEENNTITFLRKLEKGGSAHSFGINVAKLAGMPQYVTDKATELLLELEKRSTNSVGNAFSRKTARTKEKTMQLSLFHVDDPVWEEVKAELKRVDINTLTPIDAIMKLNDLKKRV